ncbi:MAG TPA: cell division protein FtsL [Methyloceanibacter sp.]|nr:cell division protein FtsL [Methyloceanibacter sp.]
MLRFVNICLVLGLVALAYVIYQVKYETRALDREMAALNKQIEQERDAIAVLRAEWSLLNRPERIERLAQKYLKLAPARPAQIVTLDNVTEADFARLRGETADAASAPQGKTSKRSPKPSVAVNEPVPKTPAGVEAWSATVVTPSEASAQ